MIEYKELKDRLDSFGKGHWLVPEGIDTTDFDFSWRPDPLDKPYIHQFGTQWQKTGGPKFVVPNSEGVKYHDFQKVKKLPDKSKFNILINTDIEFDYSWHPDDTEPEFIYIFGNQYLRAEEMPTIEYVVKNATQIKYVNDIAAKIVSKKENWVVNEQIKSKYFDFSWHPHPYDPPFIYVWGNKWVPGELKPTVEYRVPGATEHKYMGNNIELLPEENRWKIIKDIVVESFDFTWRPNPKEPDFIYVWGNQYLSAEEMPTVEYHVPGAVNIKYMNDRVAKLANNKDCWKIYDNVDKTSFDFDWTPHPHDPPFIYVWGNKWVPGEIQATIEYRVEGATEKKFMPELVSVYPDNNWVLNSSMNVKNFDFSWRPNPLSPPQIYQWENNGPTYVVPGATEVVLMKNDEKFEIKSISKYFIKTTLEDLIEEHLDEVFWALNPDLSYEKFDFNWKPDESNFRHINVFGNEISKDIQTYYVNGPMYKLGHKEFNYVTDQTIVVDSNLSMFYIDTSLSDCSERFANLKLRYPQLQKTRFLNSWVETITRCVKKSETKLFYVLSSDLDYTDFEFDFYPNKWQMNMLHVFGNQYSHWGNTYLVNSETFLQETKYIKVIEHLKNINHVRGKKAKTIVCKHDILYIDHGNLDDGINSKVFSNIGRKVFRTTYTAGYLKTLKDFINENPSLTTKQNYFVWVTNSICDYSNFDFSWQHDPFQFEQLHVFSSEFNKARQKFGDTFLINLHEFSKYINELTSLEEYKNKVNYIENLTATRKQHPVIEHTFDSHVECIKNFNSDYFPYYEFKTDDVINPKSIVPNLWDKTPVIIGSKGASDIYVPNIAIKTINEEVYDYPYIDKAKQLAESKPLDIIFISNGEPIAEENYETLIHSLKKRNIPNRVIRVKDVNGRVASQHTAANSSNTKWYFLVNGKVRVNDSFDWSWQPDRLQQPKHYIFTVTNPVNGLIYGHQAIVANNKKLTLNTVMKGLDFTLDSLHEVVDMNCGTAIYNTDEWTAWRTAFRESIKLSNNKDAISKFRLERWTGNGTGDYCEVSQRGALDGIEYYESVNGDLDKLLLSYDWEWIKTYYNKKYKN